MNRFVYHKQKHTLSRQFLSVGVFILIALVFFQGVSSISDGTKKRQRKVWKMPSLAASPTATPLRALIRQIWIT